MKNATQKTKNVLSRRDFLKLGATGMVVATSGLAAPAFLRAADYPTQPINIVVPFATGGYNDRLARAFPPFLQKELGQPMQVINRPGAGGMLGHSYFMQQKDDGYTILCTSATPYIPTTILTQKAPYKAEDFYMINLPSRDSTLAATAPGSQIQNWGQVIQRLKDDPRSLSLGIQPGSADHLNMLLALQAEGIDTAKVRTVTYDGGGPNRTATAGGHVDVGLVGAQGFLPMKSIIRPLMIFDEDPFPGFDEIETMKQYSQKKGLKVDFVAGSQRGWAVHATFVKNHPDRYQLLLKAIERATKNPECVSSLKNQQLDTDWYGPEASNRTYLNTCEIMKKFVHLLKA
jgi:tripartite-type tricarboxylate transporter receptor subunit TctC